ncbi:biopolymer transporter ExbD [Campylobacter geochelonis]|uniref:ExbD\TolR family transport protein n=1 Tax=Campylobacter geochelonis TaxID=1780362 RepID=A0A128ED92_9BACT|nr:biopolymer transporter ExbD [Campylobacter geochelonis]QKF70702.1 Tol-Pal system subunit TolR [Campylobacter geochelonis]CZE45757.1 ExbD\TolR family transport protein [Campylobacter geochelonis]CZE46889.1 ExbD\TolR family transport protein [Campylobacter geochelonis]
MYNYDEKPELNITPLVDIMLVLLAILMVTTPAIIYEEQILLPDGSQKQSSNNTKQDMIVRVDAKGVVHINNSSMSLAEFPDNLTLLSSQYSLNSPVYIQADKNLVYNDVMFVLKTLKKAGFIKVALQTAG